MLMPRDFSRSCFVQRCFESAGRREFGCELIFGDRSFAYADNKQGQSGANPDPHTNPTPHYPAKIEKEGVPPECQYLCLKCGP